jgi:hypothetical protein
MTLQDNTICSHSDFQSDFQQSSTNEYTIRKRQSLVSVKYECSHIQIKSNQIKSYLSHTHG